MALYQFSRNQFIKASLEEVWNFIANPVNLQTITPDSMGFDILTADLPTQMYEGLIIHYRVKPFPLYSTSWVTEITHIRPMQYFIDEQRMGPYKMWHHEHWVQPFEDGVMMKDLISYQAPFGVLGRLANRLFIGQRLKQIFDYREKALADHFNQPKTTMI